MPSSDRDVTGFAHHGSRVVNGRPGWAQPAQSRRGSGVYRRVDWTFGHEVISDFPLCHMSP